MAQARRSISELAVESAMIVLSLLLALGANSCVEGRKEQQLATQARASFVQEIRANQQRLTRALPYHKALTQAVIAVDSSGGVTSYAAWQRRVPIWSGFAPPDVAATAWQSALTTGALSKMPYREVAALSSLYTIQGKLDAFTLGYLPLFDFADPAMAGTVRRMNVYMQTVLSYEHALAREYAAALAMLDGDERTR